MFDKILIANRGEIACRVIKTCRRLGIKTVAIYSDADADTLHTDLADEAVPIGGNTPAESYLVIDKVMAACRDTGAQAVHPGFGFLSEKAAFCQALEAAGIVFIGPSVAAIGAMGDKVESKRLAKAAGVTCVPGHIGIIKDPKEAVTIARDIGYPVMVKASAGGGGKGMRLAYTDQELIDGFTSAANEARTAFGDDRVFVEKFIVGPRHVEIQVLGDKHGTILYLGERECSIQRRHQKVIEEAPSPLLDAKTRQAMGEQAVALARKVGYYSAGTVEFVADGDRNFYFLEMNTRLQVEHPVTEMVTGIDIVEQMIRVAAGEKLAFGQADIKLNGWAVESRVYAEDPLRGFLPSIGRLSRFQQPAEIAGEVRVDTGVVEGSEISMFYDPMIAKLVTWGATRDDAIARQRAALDSYYIRGVATNTAFLSAVMANAKFQSGRITTGFIAEEFPDGFHGAPADAATTETLLCVAAACHVTEVGRDLTIAGQIAGARHDFGEDWVVEFARDQTALKVHATSDGYDIGLGGRTLPLRGVWRPGQRLFRGTLAGRAITVQVERLAHGYKLMHGGVERIATVYDPRSAELAKIMPVKVPPDLSRFLLCPMPGLVVAIHAQVGDDVKAGQPLAIVEAMKMENVLRAEADAKVQKILAKPGDSLQVDAVIMEFE